MINLSDFVYFNLFKCSASWYFFVISFSFWYKIFLCRISYVISIHFSGFDRLVQFVDSYDPPAKGLQEDLNFVSPRIGEVIVLTLGYRNLFSGRTICTLTRASFKLSIFFFNWMFLAYAIFGCLKFCFQFNSDIAF